MKVSVRDISQATGYSPATVSNALNHKPGVSAKTAAQIKRVADELGYAPKNRLRGIRFVVARKTGAILDEGEFHPAVRTASSAPRAARGCPPATLP